MKVQLRIIIQRGGAPDGRGVCNTHCMGVLMMPMRGCAGARCMRNLRNSRADFRCVYLGTVGKRHVVAPGGEIAIHRCTSCHRTRLETMSQTKSGGRRSVNEAMLRQAEATRALKISPADYYFRICLWKYVRNLV